MEKDQIVVEFDGVADACFFEGIDQPAPRELGQLFSIYPLPVGKKIVATFSLLSLSLKWS